MSDPTPPRPIRFGLFEVDLQTGELRKQGLKVRLIGQPFDVLAMLLERPGEIVTREELQKRLWPAHTFVDFEHGLNTAVKKLREALGDDANNPQFVETLARRGYRFIAPVVGAGLVPARPGGPQGPALSAEKASPLRPVRLAPAAGLIMVIAGMLLAYWLMRPLPAPRILGSTQLTHDGQLKGKLVSDGTRLYFSQFVAGHWILAQVSVGGGEPVAIPTPFENTLIRDISPDRTELLLGSFGGIETEGPLWTLPTLGGSPRRLGNILCHDAAWAPDGKTIAYAHSQELYLAGSDGAQSRKLVNLPGVASFIRWSPNGGEIRFTVTQPRPNPNSLFTLPEVEISPNSLWQVDADGSHLRPLLAGWNASLDKCCGDWTSGGKYYLFDSSRGGLSSIWAMREKSGLLRKGGSIPVQLTTGPMSVNNPLPASEGKRLFVVGTQQRGELVRYDAKADQWLPYLSGLSAECVSFSRDRMRLAYVTYPEGNLWISQANGSEPVQLTFPPLRAFLPRWSPDGRQIAFGGLASDRHWHVFLVPVEGGSPQQLTSGNSDESDPAWSPDGSSLAYSAEPPAQYGPIRVINLRTHQVSTMPGSEDIWGPCWSPNGRYVVANKGSSERLALFDFATRKWELAPLSSLGFMTWSSDSETLYLDTIYEKDPAFYRLRMSNRKLERIVGLKNVRRVIGAFGPWSGITQDNAPLVLRDIGSQDIYALDWEAP